MKNFRLIAKELKGIHICIALFTLIVLLSCKSEQVQEKETSTDSVIEVYTANMEFDMLDTIPSGWHTFRYTNTSKEVHFLLMEKYPEGKTISDAENYIVPLFQKGMELINEGNPQEGFEVFIDLPEWYSDVVFAGGVGLLSPGQIAETTIKVEPGYYIVECYMKMENGMFHTMIRPLIVTDDVTEASPPDPNVNITISSEEGIDIADTLTSGETIFSVFFKDQKVHENFIMHDVNLVKFNWDVPLEKVEKWMDWSDPNGLRTPPPTGITFLGGVNEMPEGNTGYFKAKLEPGNYALVSEVPNTIQKGLLKTFVVVENNQ